MRFNFRHTERTHSFWIAFTAGTCLLPSRPAVSTLASRHVRSRRSLTRRPRRSLSGQGNGFAKAAELNGYPGPAHVLELATGWP